MPERLDGARILILEAREEAQFSRLLSEQGATVVQCPMFTIEDVSDRAPLEAWIARYIDAPFDDLVLTTGEGLRRLLKAARLTGNADAFVAAIGRSRTFARGPKPGRALREIGLHPSVTTEVPTSEGIVQTLRAHDPKGRRVGLQLYPEKDHAPLIQAIEACGAIVDPVLPYVYNDSAAAERIAAAISEMASGRIHAVALTSSGQVRRLFDAAKSRGAERLLREGLSRTKIASVGPVVSDELAAHGLVADVEPTNGAYFMKPLISALASALAAETCDRTTPPATF